MQLNDMRIYLSTEQAADYLGIRERKLYELVANGAVPCSKVTGKWLFPRAALDRWIELGLAQPHGFQAAQPPPIIAGSHDPLLEWAARRSSSGLALLSIGSEAGLVKLAANEAAIAAIHVHAVPEEMGEDANRAVVNAHHHLHDAVVIAFARREQGLIVAEGNPKSVTSLDQAIRSGLRFARRQPGAGAELLLKRLMHADDFKEADMVSNQRIAATGDDIAFMVKAGEADCGLATRAAAAARGLSFIPLAWERFDLVMRRRTYFEPGMQALLALMRTPEFHQYAATLGGLDVADAGTVRLVR
jgi:putative molybdopterin biosynthesis protein